MTARAKKDDKAAEEANGEINALILFKADMGAFQRMYSFLSQIFDYGNTAIEKRFMFYRRLIPLLEFGREREGIDLSKVMLTHHSLKDQGKRQLPLGDGDAPKLPPLSEAGSGSVQEKEKARLAEIIAKVNDLFEGDLTDDDQLVYVNNVIKGKLLEVAGAGSSGEQQHQGAVRQLADALQGDHERGDGCARGSHDHEQAGDRLRESARGPEGCTAWAGAALRGVEGQGRSRRLQKS